MAFTAVVAMTAKGPLEEIDLSILKPVSFEALSAQVKFICEDELAIATKLDAALGAIPEVVALAVLE